MRRRTYGRALRLYDLTVNAIDTLLHVREIPPDQLLRQVLETCSDYDQTRHILETTPIRSQPFVQRNSETFVILPVRYARRYHPLLLLSSRRLSRWTPQHRRRRGWQCWRNQSNVNRFTPNPVWDED